MNQKHMRKTIYGYNVNLYKLLMLTFIVITLVVGILAVYTNDIRQDMSEISAIAHVAGLEEPVSCTKFGPYIENAAFLTPKAGPLFNKGGAKCFYYEADINQSRIFSVVKYFHNEGYGIAINEIYNETDRQDLNEIYTLVQKSLDEQQNSTFDYQIEIKLIRDKEKISDARKIVFHKDIIEYPSINVSSEPEKLRFKAVKLPGLVNIEISGY